VRLGSALPVKTCSVPETGQRHLVTLRWGLVPYFTKDPKRAWKPINARCETVATSAMFRSAFAYRRCLAPAAAYYEWWYDPEGKTLFAVTRVDGGPVAFTGIWKEWQSPEGEVLRTFATMTAEANRQLSGIQDRMPVIVDAMTGCCGWVRPTAIPAPCSAPHRTTCFGCGGWANRLAMSGMTGRSCSSRTRRRTPPLSCCRRTETGAPV
jgi:putative SOS response-associated peptidase YedK